MSAASLATSSLHNFRIPSPPACLKELDVVAKVFELDAESKLKAYEMIQPGQP